MSVKVAGYFSMRLHPVDLLTLNTSELKIAQSFFFVCSAIILFLAGYPSVFDIMMQKVFKTTKKNRGVFMV